jgi:hypothetical protein
MPRFDQTNAADALEVQQLIADWVVELDMNGGLEMPRLITADCRYRVGGTEYLGHDKVRGFYQARGERVRTMQREGVRTQRHTISTLRVHLDSSSAARVDFALVNYSGEGPAPVRDLKGPTIIADVWMECRLEADGEWRISMFDSKPVFIGNDPFLNASVVRD